MSDEDLSVTHATPHYRVLRLASLAMNAMVAGIIGTGILVVFALRLQKGLALRSIRRNSASSWR